MRRKNEFIRAFCPCRSGPGKRMRVRGAQHGDLSTIGSTTVDESHACNSLWAWAWEHSLISRAPALRVHDFPFTEFAAVKERHGSKGVDQVANKLRRRGVAGVSCLVELCSSIGIKAQSKRASILTDAHRAPGTRETNVLTCVGHIGFHLPARARAPGACTLMR